ncbi:MAG: hypothetical protein ABFC24_07595 [Methanoregulaceae archaeon]
MQTNGYVAGGFLSQTPGTIHSLDDVTLSFFIQHDAYSGNYSYQFFTGLQDACRDYTIVVNKAELGEYHVRGSSVLTPPPLPELSTGDEVNLHIHLRGTAPAVSCNTTILLSEVRILNYNRNTGSAGSSGTVYPAFNNPFEHSG